jgi:hypothetical protein
MVRVWMILLDVTNPEFKARYFLISQFKYAQNNMNLPT